MRLVALIAIVLLPLTARADEPEPIEPERAGASTSTSTVGRGAVQLEAGLAYSRERIGGSPTERRLAVQVGLRGGLTDRLELRVEGEPLVSLRGPEDVTDHGQLVVGATYRFLDSPADSWLPSLGVLPFVKLPVSEEPIDSGKTDFGLLALASFALPGQLSLDANVGMAAVGQTHPGGYLLQALAALGLSWDLAEAVVLFTDLFYASRDSRDGGNSLGLDAGVIWRLSRSVAVDAAVVTSLVGRGPDWAVLAGVSVRFGR